MANLVPEIGKRYFGLSVGDRFRLKVHGEVLPDEFVFTVFGVVKSNGFLSTDWFQRMIEGRASIVLPIKSSDDEEMVMAFQGYISKRRLEKVIAGLDIDEADKNELVNEFIGRCKNKVLAVSGLEYFKRDELFSWLSQMFHGGKNE